MAKWHDYKHWSKPKYGRQNRQIVQSNSKPVGDYKGPRVDLRRKYQSPKAKVYGGERPLREKGNSNHGVSFSAKTTVFSALSILLMIGLIATVFFAYDNSQRAEGEPFAYFSPSNFLQNLTSVEILIPADDYPVTLKMSYSLIGGGAVYYGYVRIANVEYKSEDWLDAEDLLLGRQFEFYIDGYYYFTVNGVDPAVDRVLRIEEDVIYTINDMPNFETVANAWSEVGEEGSFFYALQVTGSYLGDFFAYQSNLLKNLLPWNSVKYSNEIPADGVVYDDSWKR